MKWWPLLLTLGAAAAQECRPPPVTPLPVQVVVDGAVGEDALVGETPEGLVMLASDLRPFGPPAVCPDGSWQLVPFPAVLDHAALQVTLTLPARGPTRPAPDMLRAVPLTDARVQADVQVDASSGAAGRLDISWPVTATFTVGGAVTATADPQGSIRTQAEASARLTQALPEGARVTATATVQAPGSPLPLTVTLGRVAPRAAAPPLVITAAQPGRAEVWFGPTLLHTGPYTAGRTEVDTSGWPPVAGTLLIRLTEAGTVQSLQVPADLRANRPVRGDGDASVTVQAGPSQWQLQAQVSRVTASHVLLTATAAVGTDVSGRLDAEWVAPDSALWQAGAQLSAQGARLSVSRQGTVTLTGSLNLRGGAPGAWGPGDWALSGRVPLGTTGTAELGVLVSDGTPLIQSSVQLRAWPAQNAVTAAALTLRPGGVQGRVTVSWTVTPTWRVEAQGGPGGPAVRSSVRTRVGEWTLGAAASTDQGLRLEARGPATAQVTLGTSPRVALSAAGTSAGQLVPPDAPSVLIVTLGLGGVPVTVGTETRITGPDGRAAFSVPPGGDATLSLDDRALPLGWTADRTQWRVQLVAARLQGADLRAFLHREPLRRLPVLPGARVTFGGQPVEVLAGGFVLVPDARDGDLLGITLPGGERLHCRWSGQEELTCAP